MRRVRADSRLARSSKTFEGAIFPVRLFFFISNTGWLGFVLLDTHHGAGKSPSGLDDSLLKQPLMEDVSAGNL